MTKDSNVAAANTTLLTAQEAADYLRIPIGSLYVRISKKQLPCTRLGRLLRFKKSELDRLLAANRSAVEEADPSDAQKAV